MLHNPFSSSCIFSELHCVETNYVFLLLPCLIMQSEVNFLGRLSHPNLVKLLGYCWDDKELLLVYEFMQKGSLENHLFRSMKSM